MNANIKTIEPHEIHRCVITHIESGDESTYKPSVIPEGASCGGMWIDALDLTLYLDLTPYEPGGIYAELAETAAYNYNEGCKEKVFTIHGGIDHDYDAGPNYLVTMQTYDEWLAVLGEEDKL